MSNSYAIRQADLEAKRAAVVAQDEWIKTRAAAGIGEYCDKRAVGWLRTVVLELYGREEWKDILSAVRSVAATPRTSPWRVRDKCYEVASQRLASEHASRILEEVGSAKIVRRGGLRRLGTP